MSEASKKMTAYRMPGLDATIRTAPATRQWMDETPESYAYRCLPLNMANMHGWEVLCPVDFNALWDGTHALSGLRVNSSGAPHLRPISHFGSGILTFHINMLIQTEPGYNLFVTGPLNNPKDGIQGLSGIVETDWSPYTFTMNWKFTAKGKVVFFEKDEPICCFFPIPRGDLESFSPESMSIEKRPDLSESTKKWTESRNAFNAGLHVPGSKEQKEKWQKLYYRGLSPDGKTEHPDHQIKLRLKEFKEIK